MLKVGLQNLTFIRNYAKTRNILRNRYYKRKPDQTRLEYNEAITVIPPEFADQDEYLNEKRVGKFYENQYKSHKRRFLKSVGVQIDEEALQKKREEAECKHSKLLAKRANNDLPVADLDDPYKKPQEQCIFCRFNIELDYKNVQLLSQFVSPITGFLFRQEVTGLCWPKYYEVERTLKKARDAGLMPHRYKFKTFIHDPIVIDGMADRLKEIPNDYTKNK